ncbi:DUF7674 family protein [Aureibaculum luteum]|uniref:DUF7674 family protein n=1 Tax=Aureibaculum luteum TaxID=1548456 RepID=UPI000E48EE61|nr:hypothetical protein [Aureibaculum luteum]
MEYIGNGTYIPSLAAITEMTKQTAFDFYTSLEKQFPKIKKLQILKGIDLEEDGFENSGIMTKLAEELTQFVLDGELQEAIQFMNNVEEAFNSSEDTVTNYLYTDFLVTIMEQKKKPREYLKSIMGIKTKEHYKNLFSFYREIDV